ncbi:unnamed protein product [Brassicogethes aeneus]|uniref:PARP catalytic domain-containing protein n=1 Tax=Brassicogethes aeneus TaxID=1431903 RepID=A0A9P0AWF1_BRAAE|nr:unnamed protein product [Brassicogethes aeneus]
MTPQRPVLPATDVKIERHLYFNLTNSKKVVYLLVPKMNDLVEGFQNLYLTSRSVEGPKVIRKNEAFLRNLLELAPEFKTWTNQTFDKPFHLVLGYYPYVNREYDASNTSKRNPYYKLKHVFRVENPFILAQYHLKKVQLEERNNAVMHYNYFHGTKGENLEPICLNNFNWRKVRKGKFGRGVSFSPRSDYSKHSTRRFNISIAPVLQNSLLAINPIEQQFNAMFLCKVLQGKCHVGAPFIDVPLNQCDTTTNGKGTVFVKYEDFEYCPQYIILMNSAKNPNWVVKKINYHLFDNYINLD